MTTRNTRIVGLCGAVALGLGAALAGAPVASAQAEGRDVAMPFPTGGEHTMTFGGLTACHWPSGKGNEPVRQVFSANAYDKDAPMINNPFDPANYFPFNSATVQWTNKANGQSGAETVFTVGKEVGVRDINTGIGDVEFTITVTRSLFPTFSPGSAMPGVSSTHAETFVVQGIDPVACESPDWQ